MINLTYWILAILMLGIVILLHELGHFWGARLTGVSVMEFAVGFGPKLWSRKAKSGVTYTVRALPLGGYCRFVADDEDDEPDRPDAYYKQKIWKRAFISIAGPLMNYITAIVLLFLIFFAIGLPIDAEPVVGALIPGLPAETAGFAAGDRIVSINGIPVGTASEASDAIAKAPEGDIAFGLLRGGETIVANVMPAWVESEGRSMIGIEYDQSRTVYRRFGAGVSVKSSFSTIGNMSVMIIDVLRDLLFKGEGVEDLSGPIGTVVAIKEQTQAGGLYSYLNLAAMISVNLGLFNLLPIPGLDGSKLIFLLIEKVRGKRLDPHKEGTVLLIGFALLVGVMALAMYQDIARLLQ